MAGYVKLFSSILESTVWETPAPVRCVWIAMLAMADRNGVVEASVPGLAKRASVSRTDCEAALDLFLSPDPDSRTQEFEGRRIIAIDGGWELLNYEKYRNRASAEEKREKDAERQRRKYANDSAKKDTSHEPHAPHAASPILASAEASASSVSSASEPQTQIPELRAAKPRRTSKSAALATIEPEDRSAAWRMYATAYRARYGIDPTRNAKVNAQMLQFCSRVPIEDWGATVEHYVLSQNARYVAAGHSVGCLLQDAEKLRTEALTGRQGTAYAATKADRESGRGADYADLIARLDAESASGKAVGNGAQ